MRRFLVGLAVLLASVGTSAAAQTADSSHVIVIHAGRTSTAAYQHAVTAFAEQGFAVIGGIPDVALTAVAVDNATILVHVTVTADGTAYCSAQLVIAGGGVTVGGTGSSNGGGAIAVERGSRAGRDAWSRLESLSAALGQ